MNPSESKSIILFDLSTDRPSKTPDISSILEGAEGGMGWWRNWTELFEVRGAAHHILGEHHAELDAVLRGRSQYPEALEPMRAEVRTRAALGEPEAALEVVEQALGLPSRILSPADVAWAAAQELEAHGHLEAGAIARQLGLDWLAQREPVAASEGRLAIRISDQRVGGNIQHFLAIIQFIGVRVGVLRVGAINAHFLTVVQLIPIRIRFERIGAVSLHLLAIQQTICIRIRVIRIGADLGLFCVCQAITI